MRRQRAREGRGRSNGAQTREVPLTQDAARSSVTLITLNSPQGHRVWQAEGTQMDAFLPLSSPLCRLHSHRNRF